MTVMARMAWNRTPARGCWSSPSSLLSAGSQKRDAAGQVLLFPVQALAQLMKLSRSLKPVLGVLRDMLCNDVPILFREGYLYATAAIIGASFYVLLKSEIGVDLAGYLGMIVVAGLRLGSIAFRWNLPRFRLKDLGSAASRGT